MSLDILHHILNENFETAKGLIEDALLQKTLRRSDALKVILAHRLYDATPVEVLDEKKGRSAVRRMGRINFIRVRIRRGKVQRRKRVSAIKGYTIRKGRLIRIRPSERLHRRLAARRAKIKRRSKRSIIRRKTLIAMRKRRSLGLSSKPFGRA